MNDSMPATNGVLSDPRLPRHRSVYYGGDWHDSPARRTIDVIAPATGDALGTVIDASADDIERAVAAAIDCRSRYSGTAIT